jgi:hypothetical protein
MCRLLVIVLQNALNGEVLAVLCKTITMLAILSPDPSPRLVDIEDHSEVLREVRAFALEGHA